MVDPYKPPQTNNPNKMITCTTSIGLIYINLQEQVKQIDA